MESKTGVKTLDKISEIPLVTSAIKNASDYYDSLKQKNALTRTSCNFAEIYLRTVAYAATPITTMCKKPLDSVDTYLSDKVDMLQASYPIISKPTEHFTSTAYTQVKDIYDKTFKQPVDTFTNIKETSVKKVTDITSFGSNKISDVVKVGSDSLQTLRIYSMYQVSRSARLGFQLVDSCLEVKYAKMLTTPVLDFTEKSVDNWLNDKKLEEDESAELTSEHSTTLTRLYGINNRVAKHLYAVSLSQLERLSIHFESTLAQLRLLKQVSDNFYANSKNRLVNGMQTNTTTLKGMCNNLVNGQKISRFDALCRNYYKVVLEDVNAMVNRYMELVKTFPIVANGTMFSKLTGELMTKLNTEPLTSMLKSSIDRLSFVHSSIVAFINQKFQPQSLSRNEVVADEIKPLKSFYQVPEESPQYLSRNEVVADEIKPLKSSYNVPEDMSLIDEFESN